MICIDEDSLICDLAETYNIYDYRSLPLRTVATYSAGLRENSRIKMKLHNTSITFRDTLIAAAVDRLSLLVWSKTEDARQGGMPPQSILQILQATECEEQEETYANADEFWQSRAALIERIKDGHTAC